MNHNCPFYGCSLFGSTRQSPRGSSLITAMILVPTMGNQCALAFGAYAPCQQEMAGLPIDWRVCPAVGEVRQELSNATLHR